MARGDTAGSKHGRWRLVAGFLAPLVVIFVGLVVAVLVWSGATLSRDQTALAKVNVQTFGGKLEHVKAYGPDGREIPLSVSHGRLTPRVRLTPGEQVTVRVTIRRPGWIGWALGKDRKEELTLTAPVARVSERWLTTTPGSSVEVSFDQPVVKIAYGSEGKLAAQSLEGSERSVSLGTRPQTGTIQVAAAARTWERLGRPVDISWFPPSKSPVMVASPSPGSSISPASQIRLTFSKPVREVLGSAHPKLSPSIPGRWKRADSHTLTFTPSGYGIPFDTTLHIELPKSVAVAESSGNTTRATNQVQWTVPAGSTLRLQQLLAEGGYLPVQWEPSGSPVAHTPRAEVRAAVEPPSGHFGWRFSDTPHQLVAMWNPNVYTMITKAAIMKFENVNGMTVDGLAGPSVWRQLMSDAIAGKRQGDGDEGGYSYVYVHREVPETATLWHDGHTIISSAANTGISGAETELGTFAVFEHLPETTMSGTNPDGSHYEDPGIKWVSYFNGGDALHNFDRSSFGTPQSLGCVELPLAASAEIYKYTPIGTLVTIET